MALSTLPRIAAANGAPSLLTAWITAEPTPARSGASAPSAAADAVASANPIPKPTSVHDTEPKRWRHLDFFQHQAYLHVRVPPGHLPNTGPGRWRCRGRGPVAASPCCLRRC